LLSFGNLLQNAKLQFKILKIFILHFTLSFYILIFQFNIF